ncbi:MAG TPA: endoflagellar protein [Armatimonadetes bacterium]|nr:endoflagellar protein [Armatimonadota bacterium]
MIRLTTLDGRELVVNALLIERMEAVPDTVITLTNGRSVVVREDVETVVEEAVEYLRSLRSGADSTPVTVAQIARTLR